MTSLISKSSTHDESRLRLRTITRLHWIAVLGQAITVVGVYWGLGFPFPIEMCLSVIIFSAFLNLALRHRMPAHSSLKSAHASTMLIYDLLQLSTLLFLTGGLQNPFSVLLVVPVIVSAATQPQSYIWLTTGIALVCATLLAIFHLPLPWTPGAELVLPLTYKAGVWAGIACGIIFIALYTRRIAREGRQMSQALAAAEMVLAREQQLSALDGLAAAAAHQLGTPLSTISVIAKELERDLPTNSPLNEDISLLRSQAARCREILETLTDHDGTADSLLQQVPFTHLIEEIVAPHRALGVRIELDASVAQGEEITPPYTQEPQFVRNPGLIHALENLIENALDFAQYRVEIKARWDMSTVRLKISDDGIGFSPSIMQKLGEPYVTTRPSSAASARAPLNEAETPEDGNGAMGSDTIGSDTIGSDTIGLGLGFFIAKTLLERSGAQLTLSNQPFPEQGAIVEIVWQRSLIDMSAAPDGDRQAGDERASDGQASDEQASDSLLPSSERSAGR